MSHMETDPDAREKQGLNSKISLIAGAVIAIALGLVAIVSSLTINHGCEVSCIPDHDVESILVVGLPVGTALLVAAGMCFAALRSGTPPKVKTYAIVLGVLAAGGWVVWFLMAATAGIRATT